MYKNVDKEILKDNFSVIFITRSGGAVEIVEDSDKVCTVCELLNGRCWNIDEPWCPLNNYENYCTTCGEPYYA